VDWRIFWLVLHHTGKNKQKIFFIGLRWSILIAAWANGSGALIRLISSFFPDSMPYLRFPIGIFGQGIAALAYPFIMFLPTKVLFIQYLIKQKIKQNI
jgi:hypothetical protein